MVEASSVTEPPRTRWCGTNPFARGMLPAGSTMAKPPTDAGVALVGLVQSSLRRGHWRVALRRFEMAQAASVALPDPVRSECVGLMELLTSRELQRIKKDAVVWAQWVRFRTCT